MEGGGGVVGQYIDMCITFAQVINEKLSQWTTRTFFVVLDLFSSQNNGCFASFFYTIISLAPFALTVKANRHLVEYEVVNPLSFIPSPYTKVGVGDTQNF